MTGTGLGLFGVRTRAEGLQGTCGARHNTESSTGTGTVMWFAIPYVEDKQSESPFSSMSMDAAPPGRGMDVLYAVDLFLRCDFFF